MNIKGHKRVGLAIIAGHYIFTENLMPGVYAGVVLGTILPDLDAEYSYIKKWFPWLDKVYGWLPKDNMITKHRGLLLHSIWPILALGLLYYKIPMDFVWGILLGMLGHHFGDWITPASLPDYFHPFDKFLGGILKSIDKALPK